MTHLAHGVAFRARLAAALVAAALPVLALTGCGGNATPAVGGAGGTGTTSGTALAAAPTSTPAEGDDAPGSPGPAAYTAGSRTLAVTVTGSTITPAPTTVELPVGQTLALTVTSDHADEVHAHGFDVEKQVAAGGSTVLVLTGAEPGEYEVEMHDPVLTLLKIDVR